MRPCHYVPYIYCKVFNTPTTGPKINCACLSATEKQLLHVTAEMSCIKSDHCVVEFKH